MRVLRHMFPCLLVIVAVLSAAGDQSPHLRHQLAVLHLPQRIVTAAEYQSCKAEAERLKASPGDGRGNWNARVVARYERLAADPHPTHATPINVLRLGETVICTNQFELYTDFGVRGAISCFPPRRPAWA